MADGTHEKARRERRPGTRRMGGIVPRTYRTIAVAAATASLLTACGGEPAAITTDDEAREAVVATFTDSWSAEMRADVEITDEQVDALADALAAADPGMDDGSQLASVFETMRTQAETATSVLAHAADGSWRFASVVDGEPMVDLRVDVAELLAADSLTPDVTALAQVDIGAMLEQFQQSMAMATELEPTLPADAMTLPDLTQLRAQASLFLPDGPLEDAVLAILDGGFGGATGTLDLTALGATQDDLDQARGEFLSEMPFDHTQLGQVLSAAVTFRDLAPADGGTTGRVDLRPRAALEALGELLEEVGEVDDWRADFESETGTSIDEVPDVLPGVATVSFADDGTLRDLTVHLADVMRQVVTLVPGAPAEVRDLADTLADVRYDLVTSFTDVGQVDSVLDVDATTVTWSDAVETVQELMGRMGADLQPAA